MDQQNPNAAKRFRPDTTNIRPKQSTPMMHNRRTTAPYRASQSYSKDDEDQNSVILSSPARESFEETMTHIVTDTKQVFDIDLSMNCSDEQLSEAQVSHHAVKALDRSDNTNGMTPKVRNPVGRPRIHPRHPPNSTSTHRSNNMDDDVEEFDDWNVDKRDRKSDGAWTNGHQDQRLSWSKKTTSTNYNHSSAYPRVGGTSTYRDQRSVIPSEQYSRQNNANQDRSARAPLYPTRKTTVPYPSQSGQNTSNNSMQYSHDQPAPAQPPRPKLIAVRVRGKEPSSSVTEAVHLRPVFF